MNDYANLAPGSSVPASGKYRCFFCGEGGIADFTAKILGDQVAGAPQLRSKANQQTIRYFEMGQQFPECPNCGSGTGWTLLEQDVRDGVGNLVHDQVVEESGVCDVCSVRVVSPSGYLLTTRQVVSTPGYWRHYYETHKSELLSVGARDFAAFRRNPLMITGCVKVLADQSTNWMVCERCIGLFSVDQNITRDYARQWWESRKTFNPPGTGAVALSVVDMGLGPVGAEIAGTRTEMSAYADRWADSLTLLGNSVEKLNKCAAYEKEEPQRIADEALRILDTIYKEMDEVVASGKDGGRVEEARGRVLSAEGDLLFALAFQKRQQYPSDAKIWLQKSIAAYEKSLSGYPYFRSYFMLGLACNEVGRTSDALTFLRKAQSTGDHQTIQEARRFITMIEERVKPARAWWQFWK
jgi:hypothetical protein